MNKNNQNSSKNSYKYTKSFCIDCSAQLLDDEDIRCTCCDQKLALDEINNNFNTNLNGSRSLVMNYE